MASDPRIAALLRERDGLANAGKTERVEQIDAELKVRGYEPPKSESKPAEVVETKKVEERKQPPQGRRTSPTTES